MGFQVSQNGEVTLVEVEGQLIVGNRQELKQKVLEQLDGGRPQVRHRLLQHRLHRFVGPRRPGQPVQEDP